MKFCTNCVIPETAESHKFDNKNVCSVCNQISTKNEKIDWNARDDFHMLGGFILGVANQMGLRVRWGGCWRYDSLYEGQRTTKTNSFDDLVHIELKD